MTLPEAVAAVIALPTTRLVAVAVMAKPVALDITGAPAVIEAPETTLETPETPSV
jgi:hypothetical protein